MRQHDVRHALPFTDQTNPAKFPPYEYQEFPRMLIGKDGKNVTNTAGDPQVFHSREELDQFFEDNPVIAQEVRDNSPDGEVQRLRAENDVMKKMIEENERLKVENQRLKNVAPEEEETSRQPRKADGTTPRKKKRGSRTKQPLKNLD